MRLIHSATAAFFVFVSLLLLSSFVEFVSGQKDQSALFLTAENLNNLQQLHHPNYRVLTTTEVQRSTCLNIEIASDLPSESEFNRTKSNLGMFRSRNFALDTMENPTIDYSSTLATVYVGLIMMAVVGIIILIVGCVSIFCTAKVACLQRDLEKNPYSRCSMILSIVCTFIFSITLIVLSIVGLITNNPNETSMNSAICKTLNFAEHLSDGGVSNNAWIGTGQFEAQLKSIYDSYAASASQLATPFASATFLTTVGALRTQITNMQTSLPSSLVVRLPNPQRSALPKYVQPDLLAILGSQSILNQTTVLGSLEWEYDAKTAFETSLLTKLQTSSNVLATQTAAIQTGFSTDQSTAKSFHSRITSFRNYLSSSMDTIKKYGGISRGLGSSMYGLGIGFALIGLLSLVAMIWCKMIFAKYALIATWFVVTVGSVLLFTSSVVSYGVSVSIMENCEGFAYIVNDSTLFDKYIKFTELPELKTCFFGDGNLSQSINVRSQIELIEEVATDMANVEANSDLFEESLSLRYIHSWISKNDAYVAFTANAVEYAASIANGLDSYDSPPFSLDELNSWTNYEYATLDSRENAQYGLSCGVLARDKIVFTASFCGASVPACDTTTAVGSPCCISLNEVAFDEPYIVARLARIVPGSPCAALGTFKSKYLAYFKELKEYTTGIVSILENQVKPLFSSYELNSRTYLNSVYALYQDVQDNFKPLSDALIAKTNTFTSQSNCNFLKNEVKLMHDSLCHSYMVRSYQTSEFLILNACFFFLTALSYFFVLGRGPAYVISRSNEGRQYTMAATEGDDVLVDQEKTFNQSYLAQDVSLEYTKQQQNRGNINGPAQHTGVLENLRHTTQINANQDRIGQSNNNRELVPLPSDTSYLNNRTSRLTQARVNAQNPTVTQQFQTSVNTQQSYQTRVDTVKPLAQQQQQGGSGGGAQYPANGYGQTSKFNNVFDENDDFDDFGMEKSENQYNSSTVAKLPPKSVIRQGAKF